MAEKNPRIELDPLLKSLAVEKTLDAAEALASGVLKLIGIETGQRELLNIPRIDAELSRFELAPGFLRHPAAYNLPTNRPDFLDAKFFWVKKVSKTNLSWLVGVTPNFEDSEANDFKNIGIDFVVPPSCDSLIVILSSKYKIRLLELKDHLTHTQSDIFSVWNGSVFDASLDDKSQKRSVHQKLWESFNFEPINRKFYMELVELFGLLAHHLDGTFGRKPSVMFTTRLIGRVLFVWFLKKKNLINPTVKYFDIDDYSDQTEYYKNKLEVLFFEVLNKEIPERRELDSKTPYLNGGLFDASHSDFYGDKRLTFPVGFFGQLYETLHKYNFTVDESSPEFQQVAIDPEMLGRIFESLLAEQLDEQTDNNKKKATGAFYTPREIVGYMCEQAIIEFLRGKLPETPDRDRRIEELVRLPETIFRDQDQNKRRDWKPYADQIIKALEGDGVNQLTILDPAVGSGAFPMGMLHLLTKIYGRLDAKYEKNISKLKREILSKSLYGVDIEQTAIEICRLRAWLSIIVDVPESATVEPLPNLDFKFACANTLVPLHGSKQASLMEDFQLKEKLMSIRDEYFSTSNKEKKKKLQTEYERLCANEDLFDTERTRQLKSYKPFDVDSSCAFYDPELHHGVSSFDIVIANPPYVDIKKLPKETVVDLFSLYKTTENRINLYSTFIEKGLDLLKEDGDLTYITPNSILIGSSYKKIRHLIIDHVKLLIKLPDNIFEKAIVETIIIQAGKKSANLPVYTAYYKNDSVIDFASLHLNETDVELWKLDDSYRFNIFTDSATDSIIRKIDSYKLKQVGDEFNFSLGITPYDSYKGHSKELIKQRKFHADHMVDDTFVPLISGSNVGHYKISKQVKEYLAYGDWLGAPRKEIFFTQPRVIVRQILSKDAYGIHAGYTEEALYHTQIGFSIIESESSPFNVKTLCGLLNSRIVNFYHKFKFTDPEKDTFQKILIENAKSIPMPKIEPAISEKISELVDRISGVDQCSSEYSRLQEELDLVFYKLYGLTYEEIKVVDKSPSFSQETYDEVTLK